MKKNKEFIVRNIADETVLVPVGETTQDFNGMITLSEVGAFIWEHIEEAPDFQSLVRLILNELSETINKILNEYDVDEQTAATDAAAFLNQLLYMQMIVPNNPEKQW